MKNKIVSENFEDNSKSKVNQDKKTKDKSNAQKALPVLIVVVVSLVIILACVLIAYYQVYTSGKQNANILEGVYASSYYSMVDNVNNLSVDLSKYRNLSETEAKRDTMQDMMVDCNYIISGLSVLPIDEENAVAGTKFFNQINGLCEAYSKVLSNNGNLTQEQELVFDEVALVVEKIKVNLNTQNYGMYDTGFNFVDAGIFDKTGMNELSASLGDMTANNIDYPAMIFDGPFSTALETKQVKGLPETEISQDEARKYLIDTVYANRDAEVEFLTQTDGTVYTYDFKVTVEGNRLTAQVSKRGGLLITLSGYAEGGDAIMGVEEAESMASTFANNIGFENMKSVWREVHENVVYVNLAPVEDGVIMYPDLVKVKVDLTSQDIIGFEALNYALNHVDRQVEFGLNADECESGLGFDYNILETNKTVIRLDSGKEIACYEFITERIDGDYFYYVDANTGKIAKSMKLVTIKDVKKLI